MYYIRTEETFVHLRSICCTSDIPLLVQIKEKTRSRATQTVIFVLRAVIDGVKKYAPPFETTKLEGIVKSLPGVVGSVPEKDRGAPVLFCPTAYTIELEVGHMELIASLLIGSNPGVTVFWIGKPVLFAQPE